ncbi:MAG: gamma-glutamylcyclotransferase family protein [bacterium]
MENKIIIFTYGSLREGFHNHFLLGYSKKLGKGLVEKQKMYAIRALHPYPVSVEEEDSCIIGEVYEITDKEIFRSINNMEINAGYEPKYCEVIMEEGDNLKAIFYEYEFNVTTLEEVKSGDWEEFMSKKGYC